MNLFNFFYIIAGEAFLTKQNFRTITMTPAFSPIDITVFFIYIDISFACISMNYTFKIFKMFNWIYLSVKPSFTDILILSLIKILILSDGLDDGCGLENESLSLIF
ncbi:MAG: hypothetical protein GY756_00230 [bacterium]|nr:hypothetical protein [bacterium]